MFETIDQLLTTISLFFAAFGLPVLVVLFVLKGAFIAKPIPTSIVLPAYIIGVSPSLFEGIIIAAICSLASVTGEIIVYRTVSIYGIEEIDDRIPYFSVGDKRIDKVNTWFQSYGGVSVFVGSAIPGFRGFIIIPASLSGYSIYRTLTASYCGTFVYHSSLVFATLGIITVL